MTSFSEHRHRIEVDFDPSSTAVLVVDMLNDFCHPDGLMPLEDGAALFGPINDLISTARASGSPIIWICDEHPPNDDEFKKRSVHCLRGSWGAEIVPELDAQDSDYRVVKRRYSGFFQTDLDLRLRETGVKTLIVCGVVTNICVRSTVHDAFFRGYDVVVPLECVAATGPREQESSLYDIDTHYGSVARLETVRKTYEDRSAS